MTDAESPHATSPEQLAHWIAVADASGLTLSEWIRLACERAIESFDASPLLAPVFGSAHRVARRRGAYSPEYVALQSARARCYNPKAKGHRYYAAKGIGVHPDWMGPDGFKNFLAHVGPRPTPYHSLDRINNNGHYEPGNVRWATHAEQVRNTTKTKKLTYKGETLCLADWALRRGISQTTIRSRLARGKSVEEALANGRA